MNVRAKSSVGPLLAALFFLSFFSCRQDATTDPVSTEVNPAELDFKYTDNVVRANLPQEPRALNPLMTTQGYSRFVWEQIIQTLNTINPATYEQVPLLASEPDVFERPDGGIDYTYDLDPKANWPDGSPVTAADVVFSLKILFNPLIPESGPYRAYYDMIESVSLTPADEKRIKISTKKPYILSEAALGALPIYPEYAYDPDGLTSGIRLRDLLNTSRAERLAETNEDLKKFSETFRDPAYSRDPNKVTGSGPYRLVSWEAGQKIRLERNENYWAAGSDRAWLANEPDAIEFQFITDAATVANALRDQAFDAVIEIETGRFREFKTDPQVSQYYEFADERGFVFNALMLNNEDPILADVRVRRALAMLTDVEAIIETNYGKLATRITGPILPQQSYYNNDLEPIAYDPAAALSLLAKAGWADTDQDGTLDKEIKGEQLELELELLTFTSEVAQSIGLLVQQNAKAVGVDIELKAQDGRTLFGNLNKGDFQIATVGSGKDPGLDDLTQVYSTRSVPPNGGNRMRFGDAESDRLIDRIRVTLDETERNELYRQLQQKIYDEQPMIYLFSVNGRIVISKRFAAETSGMSPGVKLNAFEQRDWNKPE